MFIYFTVIKLYPYPLDMYELYCPCSILSHNQVNISTHSSFTLSPHKSMGYHTHGTKSLRKLNTR